MLKYLKVYLNDIFICDLRSLALMRIGIALVLIADCINRFKNFIPFHSEAGLFPREILLSQYGNPYIWSLNHIATGDWWPALLLILKLIFALSLLLGYKTRMATFCCWVLELSFQAKTPLIGQGGDVLLRMLLFWGMFLPLNSHWAIQRQKPNDQDSICSAGTIAYTLQVAFLYIFSVLLKTGDAWRKDGSAVYYALNLDHFSTALGKSLLNLPYQYLQFLSFFVLALELILPILLFVPFIQKWVRLPIILILWLMHLGFGSALAIGNFVFICLVASSGLLPSSFWFFCGKKFPRLGIDSGYAHPVIRKKLYSTIESGFVLLILVYIFLWNLGELKNPITRYAQRNSALAMILRVDQNWGMFAPFPMTDDGWFVIEAQIRNQKKLNLMSPNEALNFEKPASVKDTYSDFRWRKYMINIYLAENVEYRRPFSKFLCRQWNNSHNFEEQLIEFNIYYMLEATPLPEEAIQAPERLLIWNWKCF